MGKSLRYRLLHRVRQWLGMKRDDDFDWALYDYEYQRELDALEKLHTLCLEPGDGVFEHGVLALRPGIEKPLHPNHRLLYETILRLAPESVLEFGCGGGDHLHNLATLIDGLEVHGLDRARGQLGILARRHPELVARTRQQDITAPLPGDVPTVDVAYTQAVLMHIQTGDAHLRGLRNMFGRARRAVVLLENWLRHPFLEDIRGLQASGDIPWDDVHLHVVDSPEYERPHLLVAAPQPLDGFTPLEDYSVLTAPMEADAAGA